MVATSVTSYGNPASQTEEVISNFNLALINLNTHSHYTGLVSTILNSTVLDDHSMYWELIKVGKGLQNDMKIQE